MIAVKLYGGLGNQMFQYAIARKLSVQHRTDIVFDLTHYETDMLRKFDLSCFGFMINMISGKELCLFELKREKNFLKRGISRISRFIEKPVIIREKVLGFDPEVFLRASKYTYLDGYWGSPKYFDDIREVLLRDFSVIKPLENLNLKWAQHIQSVNSVSLHVRRGDFVSDAKTSLVHGVCSIEYYHEAIKQISRMAECPIYFVFSDDIPWVKANLNIGIPVVYVDHNNSETAYEDLRLMSLCNHNIIANSTFSWWGAWLNNNAGKIVVAPRKWFNNFNADTKDLYPESWMKI